MRAHPPHGGAARLNYTSVRQLNAARPRRVQSLGGACVCAQQRYTSLQRPLRWATPVLMLTEPLRSLIRSPESEVTADVWSVNQRSDAFRRHRDSRVGSGPVCRAPVPCSARRASVRSRESQRTFADSSLRQEHRSDARHTRCRFKV